MKRSLNVILSVIAISLLTYSISDAQTTKRMIKILKTQPVGTKLIGTDVKTSTQGKTAQKMLMSECLKGDITAQSSIMDASVRVVSTSGHISSIKKKIFSEPDFNPSPDSKQATHINTVFNMKDQASVKLRYSIVAGTFENSECPKTALVLMQMFPATPNSSSTATPSEADRSKQTGARETRANLVSPIQSQWCTYEITLPMTGMLRLNEHFAKTDKIMVVPMTVCSENPADPAPGTVVFTFKKTSKNESNFEIVRTDKGKGTWSEIQLKEF